MIKFIPIEKTIKICTVHDCNKKLIARGLCHTHYKRWQKTKDPNVLKKEYICSVENCTNKNYGKGFCSRHFNQYRRSIGYCQQASRKISTRFKDNLRYAKQRKLEWALTIEEYSKLLENKCLYCKGDLPPTKVGLDRKDNDLGYTIDNVVPCCAACNQLRSNAFTYEEFLEFSKTDLFMKICNRRKEKIKDLNLKRTVYKI